MKKRRNGMGKILRCLAALSLVFFYQSVTWAHHILFYYNSANGTHGVFLRCVDILRSAGHQVKVIDVAGTSRDPTPDNWGPPFDQVWDLRLVDENPETCGSGKTSSADYFDAHWRRKAVSYLSHCGKLFLAGENYQLTNRDEGLYEFLKEIQAVKEGFDTCPPAARGNSSTRGPGVYPVHNGLGPTSFYGAWVGGIPLACLNGVDFVDTGEGWTNGDQVDRSIVSGWTGDQWGGKINGPLCARGRLFMVWDATMWELWEPGLATEVKNPIWDESSWPPQQGEAEAVDEKTLQYGKSLTRKFFPAVAMWLGSRNCPCQGDEESVHPKNPGKSGG